MRLEITSESHNRVDWVVRTKILWLEAGLVLGVLISTIIIASTASPIRWRVVSWLIGTAVVVAGILAATTPLHERGFVERLPEGGALVLTRTWIPIGAREAITIPVDLIAGFKYEVSVFQDSDEDRYSMARLWVNRLSDTPVKLTAWLDPETVSNLGEALGKACRCEVDRGDSIESEVGM
ncbi:MAG: hypothetical protein E4H27_00670 [Anaerolineales bacterium]|nr:MAG: hypothetical protein E4H27_00670 [Anaerolineales bacterium]